MQALNTALETAINGYLRLDSEHSAPLLDQLEGKCIAVQLSVVEQIFYFCPSSAGMRVRAQIEQPADVHISANPLALARLMRTGQPSDDVNIRGDIETAAKLQTLLSQVEIDWEEQLSHLVGDIAAHQLGNHVRTALHWGNQTVATLLQNTSEYLHYEHADLPDQHSVTGFLDAVDELCADSERLAARIERLQRMLAPC